MPSKSQVLRPRLCTLEKGDNGYGFHLHGEKGKTGQFIRLVEPDSPAETSGLRAGDRLVFVNGEDVENESHQQVVSRIRATEGRLELIVVDPDTEQLLKKHNIKCLKGFVTDGVPLPFDEEEEEEEEAAEKEVVVVQAPEEEEEQEEEQEEEAAKEVPEDAELDETDSGDERHAKREEVEEEQETPRESTPVPDSNGEIHGHVEKKLSISSEKEVSTELRPRLCVIQRGPNGYGFNLHSERARPGQYIRAVDEDSPAEREGLQPKDRIVQVNGVSVEGKTHSEVVAAIKAGGHETRLLVVDPETDAFFKRCRVTPTSEHLTGPLPEPVINGGMEEKVNGRVAKEAERDSKLSVSPSPSNASSNASLTTPPANTPPEVRRTKYTTAACSRRNLFSITILLSLFLQGPMTDAIPALNMTLQQVKELAHQKRSNKRAPPMDWTKKNELFSNL
uniref:Na(+)/H(+) exchange regulatory cofactor NHE-RF1 n=1 Tax=Amphiprion percula TaxID=161767 RepID=A0A3P8T9R6_AMPPE